MVSREFGSEINHDNLSNVGEQAAVDPAPTRVAQLRSFLDDFGRKNKEHFEKSLATTADADVQKSPVRRPKIRRSVESGPTPLPNEAANVLVRRIMKPTCNTAVALSKFKKVEAKVNIDVEATNEGYAPVEQLCKWLADDPTSTKKIRQLRRGSNVLAKSRAFDKGLANQIVVENKIKKGNVSSYKKQFERRDTLGASIVRKNRSIMKTSANSEILTPNDETLAKAQAVKQQWRDRIHSSVATSHDEKVENEKESDDTEEGERSEERSEVGSSVTEVATSTLLDRIITENDQDEASMFLDTPSECSQATVEASLPPSASSESMDFRQARELVIKRSGSNGSADEMVQLRKKKFEKLQKDLRRKTGTHGLLKASWDVEKGNYVKKFVSDIPPKRSLHELP